MADDTILPFSFPAVSRKKITAAFDGGRLTSDGGVMLLGLADRRIGVAEKLSIAFPERRDRSRIVHSLADMIRARTFAIACGYEDGNDLDHLRRDPAFKLACGRLPDTGRDLCSQPTLSRLENAPRLREVIRLSYALVDLWMDSYEDAPSAVTLDIDDTVDVAHGRQQLSFFNAYYDEYCFLPIHVYDTERSRPVAVVLRPGRVPKGTEVRAHLRRLVRYIRRRWPATRITFRGDNHYACPEAMVFCEHNSVDYIFGLAGKTPLAQRLHEVADAIRTERALDNKAVVRGYAETTYRAGSWDRDRRVIARIEATEQGLHSLCRHQPGHRLGQVDLRQPLLRARPSREPDQAAQDPACLRPHQLPLGARQPSPPGLPHRRLLARPHHSRHHSEAARFSNGRVRHHQATAAENRRPHHRDRRPRPSRLCGSLS